MSQRVLKNDKYKKSRGGHSRLLDVSCEKCGEHLCFYQKDGPGILKRMYVDRIIEPEVPISGKNLSCKNDHLIGIRIIFKKENRPAFRLFVGSIQKKVSRL